MPFVLSSPIFSIVVTEDVRGSCCHLCTFTWGPWSPWVIFALMPWRQPSFWETRAYKKCVDKSLFFSISGCFFFSFLMTLSPRINGGHKEKGVLLWRGKGDMTFNSFKELESQDSHYSYRVWFWDIWTSSSSDVQRKGWWSVTLKQTNKKSFLFNITSTVILGRLAMMSWIVLAPLSSYSTCS